MKAVPCTTRVYLGHKTRKFKMIGAIAFTTDLSFSKNSATLDFKKSQLEFHTDQDQVMKITLPNLLAH